MAALRVAARRLVSGGGQTPIVAVGEAQRRIFPRLFQVNRARSTTSSAAAANSNTAAAEGLEADGQERLLKEICNRREQLYDLTSEAETMYNIPGRAGQEVARLRQELAAQIEPRPDRMWRILLVKSIFERFGGFAAFMFSLNVLMGMALGSIVKLGPEERRWIKKKRKEEASKGRSGDNVSLK